MGIKNLPNKLNEAGKIKIGMKGEEITSKEGTVFRPPTRLDHFIITSTDKTEAGDFVQDTVLMDKIKASGRGVVNSAGDLVGIPVRLLYEDTDLNFPTRYASYVSGKLSCTGDGVASTKRLDDFKVEYSCPCDRLNPEYKGKDKCKATGKLTVVIDEASLFGQAHVFRTTGINSVMGIMGGIELIRTATKGHIAGLPLMLVVNNKSTTVPGEGTNTTVQVVSLCYRGDMMALRQETIKLLKEDQQFLIGMDELQKEAYAMGRDVVVSDEEERDFVEEFMPDARDESQAIKEVKNQQAADVVVDVQPEPEPEQAVQQKEVQEIEKPTNEMLLDRIVSCDDLDLSISLIRQLQKSEVVQYLKKYFPEVAFNAGDTKAVLVGMAVDLTKQMFAPQAEEQVAAKPESEPETQNSIKDEKPSAVANEYSWDDGPEITREQKIEILKLKTSFDKIVEGPESRWSNLIGSFVNKEGAALKTAVGLTTKQANVFIQKLNLFIDGEIPF
ncbi:MAG: hypothetical protein WBN66_03605 [Smithella sp.]